MESNPTNGLANQSTIDATPISDNKLRQTHSEKVAPQVARAQSKIFSDQIQHLDTEVASIVALVKASLSDTCSKTPTFPATSEEEERVALDSL